MKVNRNLVYVNLHINSNSNAIFVGDIFEILGRCCPLMQNCELNYFKLQATDIQIDTFTKGCRDINLLEYERGSNFCYKLLHSLSRYSPALEVLELNNYGSYNYENNNDIVISQQSTSLQSLSNGCPLLHTLNLYNFKNLSTSDISYLLNHSTNLQSLCLSRCNLCKDGGVITKDEDKLKYLKILKFYESLHITDESIINIVKGCYNLEDVDIRRKLTNACLFSIAQICPNLKGIYLDFDNHVNITTGGLFGLFIKCSKLTDNNNNNKWFECYFTKGWHSCELH